MGSYMASNVWMMSFEEYQIILKILHDFWQVLGQRMLNVIKSVCLEVSVLQGITDRYQGDGNT